MTTMLDRFRRSSKGAEKAEPPKSASDLAPRHRLLRPGPDEETVRIARKDFRKRRNAGRWRLVRRLVLALLLVGLVAGSVWVVFFSSYVTAREVDVVGTRTIPDARIERAANVPVGTPLARVDLNAIVKRVQPIGAVRYVKVAPQLAAHRADHDHRAHPDRGDRPGLGAEGTRRRGGSLRRLQGQAQAPAARAHGSRHSRRGAGGGRPRSSTRCRRGSPAGSTPSRWPASTRSSSCSRNGRKVIWGSAEDSDQKAEVLAVLLKQPGNQIDVTVPGRPTTR